LNSRAHEPMPVGWSRRVLGDVADINPESLSASTPPDSLFDYIDLSSVERGRIHWDMVRTEAFRSAPSRARRVVKSGDVLLGTVRPTLKSHGFVTPPRSLPLVASTGFSVIRARPSESWPRFLFHTILGEAVSQAARRMEVGSNYPAVNESDVRLFPILCPPVPEQRQIAAILDTVDDAIRKTEGIIDKLKQIEHGLLHDVLTRGVDECGELRPSPEDAPDLYKESPLGTVPEGWAIGPFSAYASPRRPFLKTGPFGTSLKGEHWVDSGVPVITIGALGEGSFTHSELLHVSERTAKSLSAYVVEEGDIVFSRVADVGRSVVVSAGESGWIMSSNLMWISLDSAKVRPHYVWLNLSANSTVRAQVRRFVNAGGREVANGAVLRSLVLAWPDHAEQERIVQAASALSARVRSEEGALAKFRATRRGLADDLLTGRARVKVPEEATQ
jgi:type I restriction enzyme S subunit